MRLREGKGGQTAKKNVDRWCSGAERGVYSEKELGRERDEDEAPVKRRDEEEKRSGSEKEDCGWPAGDAKRARYTDKVGDERASWRGARHGRGGQERIARSETRRTIMKMRKGEACKKRWKMEEER